MKTTLLAIVSVALFGAVLLAAPEASACGSCGCEAFKTKSATPPKAFDKAPAVGTKATCPVMGESFTVTAKSERSQHNDKHYAFCCEGCKTKFDKNPKKYTR